MSGEYFGEEWVRYNSSPEEGSRLPSRSGFQWRQDELWNRMDSLTCKCAIYFVMLICQNVNIFTKERKKKREKIKWLKKLKL